MSVSPKRKGRKAGRVVKFSVVPARLPDYLRHPEIPAQEVVPSGYTDAVYGGSFDRHEAALLDWLVDVYGLHPTQAHSRAYRIREATGLLPGDWLRQAHEGGRNGVPLPSGRPAGADRA